MRTILGIFIVFLMMLACCNTPSAEVLLETDRMFSQTSEEKGMQRAFLEFADDSAVLLRKNSMPLVGRHAMEELFKGYPDTGYILTWEPLAGDISRSGDLGYTYGIYTLTITKDESTGKGKYVSVWKKQSDGSWKWVLDAGNEGI